jgi:ribosomal protein S18 acetylase RimI-like enzyme
MEGDALVEYGHRANVVESELQDLFEVAWGSRKCDFGPVLARSFTWITARVDDRLVCFVNVAWDGGVHFFLLDTTVHPDWRRQGIGEQLVREALADCHGRGEWLHVDSDDGLMASFYGPCGFEPVPAGLIHVGRDCG